ncbi:MAG: hypothetical protein ACLFR2_03920 [Candidatus Kapaibacterium sp.]
MKVKCLIFVLIILTGYESFSQCSCIGGAAVGGLTPVGGTVNIGVLRDGFLRVSGLYKYSSGDEYYRGNSPAEKGLVENYHIHYTGLLAAYGISNKLTAELELGGFLQKNQDFGYYNLAGSGLSHMTVSAKYNIYHNIRYDYEITAGLGGRVPLNLKESNLPQHVLPSTGAYGLVFQAFIHKGFKDKGLRLFLIQRTELNAENDLDYRYGEGFYTSLFASKSISKGLSGILELRNEFRNKDEYLGEVNNDSGGSIFIISPQLNYVMGNFYLSALYDYPIYKYYNGYQLSNNSSFAINLTWQVKI